MNGGNVRIKPYIGLLLAVIVFIIIRVLYSTSVSKNPVSVVKTDDGMNKYVIQIQHGEDRLHYSIYMDPLKETMEFHTPKTKRFEPTNCLLDFNTGFTAVHVLTHDTALIARTKISYKEMESYIMEYEKNGGIWPILDEQEKVAAAQEIEQSEIETRMGKQLGEYLEEVPAHWLIDPDNVTPEDVKITKPDKAVDIEVNVDVLGVAMKVSGKIQETEVK